VIKIIKNSGLVHAVYGNGKGKTTSAMGLAIRAAGAGYQVDIVQFMKDGRSSEVSLLRKMPGINYYCPGPHDFQHLDNSPNVKSLEHARLNLKYAKSCSTNGTDLLICDEILNAFLFSELSLDEIIDLVTGKRRDLELVLTGMYCPDEIKTLADYCSEIREINHPYRKGIEARIGIEY
jgi:cob(I)alamin adenosyltransferase|tara:strand:- start:108 stop:641 length:534 start_codon:yes stop_codon:yes gene_type:complete